MKPSWLRCLLGSARSTYSSISTWFSLMTSLTLCHGKWILAFATVPLPAATSLFSKLLSTERRLVASRPIFVDTAGPIGPKTWRLCLPDNVQRAAAADVVFQEGVEVGVCAKVRTASTISLQRCVRDGLGLSLLVDWRR